MNTRATGCWKSSLMVSIAAMLAAQSAGCAAWKASWPLPGAVADDPGFPLSPQPMPPVGPYGSFPYERPTTEAEVLTAALDEAAREIAQQIYQNEQIAGQNAVLQQRISDLEQDLQNCRTSLEQAQQEIRRSELEIVTFRSELEAWKKELSLASLQLRMQRQEQSSEIESLLRAVDDIIAKEKTRIAEEQNKKQSAPSRSADDTDQTLPPNPKE